MNEHAPLLLVEDDLNFGLVLKNYLEMNGFMVIHSPDGSTGWRDYNESGPFALCILDVMMPYKDGFTLANEIKKVDPEVPLIFLTAKALKEDQIRGYKLGADDYIIKPFDSELLLHKIRAVLQRGNTVTRDPGYTDYRIGGFEFNYSLRKISLGEEARSLSPKEADLLKLLCDHMDHVLPRDEALLKIWKEDSYFTGRSMDVYITKLRKYLSADPSISITNIHGSGFRLYVEPADSDS